MSGVNMTMRTLVSVVFAPSIDDCDNLRERTMSRTVESCVDDTLVSAIHFVVGAKEAIDESVERGVVLSRVNVVMVEMVQREWQ